MKVETKPYERNNWGFKLLLSLAGITAAGGFIADWNKTHLFNPEWTPHSKFHDAISITLATFLGSAAFYFLNKKDGDRQTNLALGALLPGFFWTSMLAAFAFPGAKGIEAEFPEKIPKVGPVWLNEGPVALLLLALTGIGYYKARRVDLEEKK